jgi:hypothetical protein
MPNPAVITTEDAVISEIEIAAPPERVFQALIDREQALRWGTNDAFEIKSWEMDARPGGKWRFVSKERTGTTEKFCRSILPGYWFTAGLPTGMRNLCTKLWCGGISRQRLPEPKSK